jgi:hypothetical protein
MQEIARIVVQECILQVLIVPTRNSSQVWSVRGKLYLKSCSFQSIKALSSCTDIRQAISQLNLCLQIIHGTPQMNLKAVAR